MISKAMFEQVQAFKRQSYSESAIDLNLPLLQGC